MRRRGRVVVNEKRVHVLDHLRGRQPTFSEFVGHELVWNLKDVDGFSERTEPSVPSQDGCVPRAQYGAVPIAAAQHTVNVISVKTSFADLALRIELARRTHESIVVRRLDDRDA